MVKNYNLPDEEHNWEVNEDWLLDQVYATMQGYRLPSDDPELIRLFIREYKKTPKDADVLARANMASQMLAEQKERFLEGKPPDTKWPPDRRMPLRYQDPKDELQGLILGRRSRRSLSKHKEMLK